MDRALRRAGYPAHEHFWERALSRRQFVRTAVGLTAAAVAGVHGWSVVPARAQVTATVEPRPIPGGFELPGIGFFHVFPPALGNEPSTITDFNGLVGLAVVDGTGTRINKVSGARSERIFEVDMRFMKGSYVGVDGNVHGGTFAFI